MKSKRRPIRVNWKFIDLVEKELARTLRRHLYDPIVKILKDEDVIQNANTKLIHDAIRSGRIKYWDNKFTGQFSAALSKELKELGAVWHLRSNYFYLPLSKLPRETQDFLFNHYHHLVDKFIKVDDYLKKIDPEKVARSFKAKNLFVLAVKKSEDDIASLTEKTIIRPDQKTVRKVASAWDYKIGAGIKRWTTEEVTNFRNEIRGLILQGKRFGKKNRPGELEQIIYKKYKSKILATIDPVTQIGRFTKTQDERIMNKAYFLARNETRLMMTSYEYERMQNAGSTFFKWQTVVGTPNHPVRPSHKRLDGKVYRWDDPPLDIQVDKKILPGQIYNCRCTAIPLFDEDIALNSKGDFKKLPDGSYALK